jgi:methyltransferase (TIGR00027 family)
MKYKQRNSTAAATAAMRAAHLLYHQPVVFNDPYALQLTSPALRRVCQNRFFRWLLRRKFISESLRPITAQVVSRAKYAEEKLEQAVSKGISQYVIVSAGFDSFCLRRPDFSTGLQIYEIDHPATQQIKQKRLLEILDSFPEGVEFLAVDLEKRTIADALSDSSFSKGERAFFSWLGTVPYISEDAVFNVLRELASFAVEGSEIVFDYLIPISMWALEERQALLRILRLIGRRGEPVKSFFEPNAFPDEISRLGYHIFENISPDELNNKYFSDRSDGLVTHSAAYNIHAEIIKGQVQRFL